MYAKLGVSQSELEEICTGYSDGQDGRVFWLLPTCIAEMAALEAMPNWEYVSSTSKAICQ